MRQDSNFSFMGDSAWWLAIFVVLYTISLFGPLNEIPLSFEEPRRGIVALEMMFSGNYAVPAINGELYLNKPPVYNWLLVFLFNLTGSFAEWVVRLPTVLSILIIGFAHYLITRKAVDHSVALLSSVFFVTSADIYFYFSLYGEIDLFYSLIVYLQVSSIFIFYQKKNFWMLFIVSYFLTAAGLLTKGLPSLAFQGLTLLACAVAAGQFKKLFSLAHMTGITIMLVILSGYFSWYSHYADPLAFIANLVSESTRRTITDESFWKSIQHLFTFPLLLIKVSLPWVIFIIPLWVKNFRETVRSNHWVLFSFLFLAVNLIIYWLSPGTRNRYLYMFLPFIFTITSYVYVRFWHDYPVLQKMTRYLFGGMIFVFIGGLLILPWLKLDVSLPAWWISTGFALLVTLLLFIFIKYPRYQIVTLLFLMLLFRFFFNLSIGDTRQGSQKLKEEILAITEQFPDEPIYLLAPFEPVPLSLNIPGLVYYQDTFQELQWPPFALSYYFSADKKSILQHQDMPAEGNLYLAEERYLPEGPLTAINCFSDKHNKYHFVLFRYGSTKTMKGSDQTQ